jgi:hypothetical protein
VRNWQFPSPAQVDHLLSLNLRTVEDVATANEESIQRLGMGGNGLKQAAADFLKGAAGDGRLIKELDALRVEREALQDRTKVLEAQLQELAAQVKAFTAAGAIPKGKL